MMRYPIGGVLAAVAMVLLATNAAISAPVSSSLGALDRPQAGAMLERVHGCHRVRELGAAGWHRHSGPACRRIATYPPPRLHKRVRPRCETTCFGVGELRVCKRDC